MGLPKEYLAPQGSVWDQISYKFFGDERFIDALLEANPSVRNIVRFEKPTLIIIPDRPAIPADSVSRLPPWKQAG
jgi:phage tail protein X